MVSRFQQSFQKNIQTGRDIGSEDYIFAFSGCEMKQAEKLFASLENLFFNRIGSLITSTVHIDSRTIQVIVNSLCHGGSLWIGSTCLIQIYFCHNYNLDSDILITGESGTGKELFAHAIHNYSHRKDYPFIVVNCAAIPETLLESELFGYEEGAFTGAKKGGKIGLFEFAHMGTLFLDELEGMSPALQVKLLRVIQEKELMRIGGDKVINVDVRIIATTNEELRDLVKEGKFRKDLYYRMSGFTVEIENNHLLEREKMTYTF